jgi:hypothetical protein
MAYQKLTASQKRRHPLTAGNEALIEESELDGAVKQYNFHEQLQVGKTFEAQTYTALKKANVTFREATLAEQFLGFDFITARGVKIECKLDTYCQKNGNLFIELTQGSKLGCIFTTTADVILFSTTQKVYVFTPLELRVWFANNSQTLTLKTVSTNTTGVLYPVEDALDEWVSIENFDKYLRQFAG